MPTLSGLRPLDYVRLLLALISTLGASLSDVRFPSGVVGPRGVYGFHDGDLGWTFGALGPELILANNINPRLSGFICGFKTG